MSTDIKTSWHQLHDHRAETEGLRIDGMFRSDPTRFRWASLKLDDLLLDFSKTQITRATIAMLCELARATGVEARRDRMFAGEAINETEDRAVLHVALRNQSDRPINVDGRDVMPDVRDVLSATLEFAEGIRAGTITSADGRKFSDVVNIGIGGSDLGPAMATAALKPYHDGPNVHFISNVDGAHLRDTLKPLDAKTTLFVVASKTFTTIETMTNAASARRWIVDHLGEDAVADHFVAISTAAEKIAEFGIRRDRAFGFWDWVGGRYSIWSAIGLPLMIAIGAERFEQFLTGAHEVDEHFRTEDPPRNIPIMFALVGIWHRNICGYPSRAVLPYDQRLARFPAYLQQLDMESNGKTTLLTGAETAIDTGPIVWGEPGTNGQHAFFQLLHQGTAVVPCEFLVAAEGHEPFLRHHHEILMANCLAQSEALMRGRSGEEVMSKLKEAGVAPETANRIAPHKVFAGNRPSVTIAYRKLDPHTLGRLIAMYEHRVFVEGTIWGINSFDQWGVELGKEMATMLLPVIKGEDDPVDHDGSTCGLVSHFRSLLGK